MEKDLVFRVGCPDDSVHQTIRFVIKLDGDEVPVTVEYRVGTLDLTVDRCQGELTEINPKLQTTALFERNRAVDKATTSRKVHGPAFEGLLV